MAIAIIILSAFFASLTNYFMRRSIDVGGSSKIFLIFQFSLSTLVAFILNPLSSGIYTWNNIIGIAGLFGGLFLGGMLWAVGKAMEYGPSTLSFATLNSATVMPAVVMALLFGKAFGHGYSFWNGIGSLFVIIGLFWAAKKHTKISGYKEWAFFAITAFLLHVGLIVVMQWRALLINEALPTNSFLPFHLSEDLSQWFMPMICLGATLVNLINYLFLRIKPRIRKREIGFGILGGTFQGLSVYHTLMATEVASPWENAMIFPTFCVALILMCNAWGRVLYKEAVHWKANILCLLGILVGTIDWGSLL